MNLPKFTHLTPSTLNEALSLLRENAEKARIIAGGTDLIVAMKQRTALPEFLINIKGLKELDSIRNGSEGIISIGPLTTLQTISKSDLVRQRCNLLAQAAEKVASLQIRNVGTIGGNVCLNTRCWYYNQSEQWRRSIPRCFKMGGDACLVMKKSDKCNAVFVADTVPALIALGAELKIKKENGERIIPIEKFYIGGNPPNLLKPEEILTEIRIPIPPSKSQGIFLKFAPREVVDFALVNAAFFITFEGEVCKDARIVIGGVTSSPIRSVNGENLLKGEKITEKLIEETGKVIVRDVEPISPIWMSPGARRDIIKVLVKRGLQKSVLV